MSQMLDKILAYGIEKKASDIHIAEGSPVTFRIKKKMSTLSEAGDISKESIQGILLALMNDNQVRAKEFLAKKDADFAYTYKDGTSFRVNAYMKIGKIAFALRRIESEPLAIEVLGLPE